MLRKLFIMNNSAKIGEPSPSMQQLSLFDILNIDVYTACKSDSTARREIEK